MTPQELMRQVDMVSLATRWGLGSGLILAGGITAVLIWLCPAPWPSVGAGILTIGGAVLCARSAGPVARWLAESIVAGELGGRDRADRP